MTQSSTLRAQISKRTPRGLGRYCYSFVVCLVIFGFGCHRAASQTQAVIPPPHSAHSIIGSAIAFATPFVPPLLSFTSLASFCFQN
eukprot:3871875-Pyramimonas_sp.AAC.1